MITISWTAVHMFASFGLLDGLLKGLQQRGQVQGTSAALHTNTRTETDFVSTNIQEDRLKMKAGAVGLITAQLLDEAPGNQMEWFYEADGLQGARGKDGKGGDVADIRVDTSDLNHGKEVSVSPIKQFFFGVRKSSA